VWIEALRIEGGVLDGFNQHFGPRLNVLIGGRGTGKSSVIELMRFCLGSISYTEDGRQDSIEHALGVLGDGRVTVTLTDGRQRIEITRTAQDTEAEVSELFLAPFVFSQSEIEDVGLQADSRMRLIDDFISLQTNQRSKESVIGSKIRSATTEIRSLLSEIDDIREKTADLPKLLAQLDVLKAQMASQSKVHKEIEADRAVLAEITPLVAAARVRSETIGRSADKFAAWSNMLEDVLDRKPLLDSWPAQAATADELGE
jgi:DNA repair exonuclease SbcCD ATPase subunit